VADLKRSAKKNMSLLRPDEKAIEGQWRADGAGKIIADEAASRIEGLVSSHLVFIAASPDGWSKLYRDPKDGRLWEHTYPRGEMHGGGPPRLAMIVSETARLRYSVGL
jgi:hypothetical protein